MEDQHTVYIEQYKYRGREMQIGYFNRDLVDNIKHNAVLQGGRPGINGLRTIAIWTIKLKKPIHHTMTERHISQFIKGRRI